MKVAKKLEKSYFLSADLAFIFWCKQIFVFSRGKN